MADTQTAEHPAGAAGHNEGGQGEPGRWFILINVALMTFMGTLDASIVNVALPDMAEKLQRTPAAVNWVATVYLIVVTAVIIIAGRLGDILGNKWVFRAGVLIFTVGSLSCAISPNLELLIAARVLQALGASCTMGASQGIITRAFPPNQRGRALGTNGTFVALGSLAGPALGGVITQFFSWHYIFWINVPVGIFVFIAAFFKLRGSERHSEAKFDGFGAGLLTASLLLMFGAFNLTQLQLMASSLAQDLLLGSAALLGMAFLALFIKRELHHPHPVLDLKIFRHPMFTLSIICAFLYFAALNSYTIIFPYYLRTQLSLGELVIGLCMAANPVLMAVLAPLSGHLSDKGDPIKFCLAGLLVNTVGFALMSLMGLGSPLYMVVPFVCVLAVGGAMFNSPNTSLIMSTVEHDRLGVAGSVNGLVRNLGMTVGTLLSTTILFTTMSRMDGTKTRDFDITGPKPSFIAGMRGAYLTAVGILLIGVALTGYRMWRLRREKR